MDELGFLMLFQKNMFGVNVSGKIIKMKRKRKRHVVTFGVPKQIKHEYCDNTSSIYHSSISYHIIYIMMVSDGSPMHSEGGMNNPSLFLARFFFSCSTCGILYIDILLPSFRRTYYYYCICLWHSFRKMMMMMSICHTPHDGQMNWYIMLYRCMYCAEPPAASSM